MVDTSTNSTLETSIETLFVNPITSLETFHDFQDEFND
jgi:hypothetical protein